MGRSGPNKEPTKGDNLKVLRGYQALSRTKKKEREGEGGKEKEKKDAGTGKKGNDADACIQNKTQA